MLLYCLKSVKRFTHVSNVSSVYIGCVKIPFSDTRKFRRWFSTSKLANNFLLTLKSGNALLPAILLVLSKRFYKKYSRLFIEMKYKVRYFVNNMETDTISRFKMHYNKFV